MPIVLTSIGSIDTPPSSNMIPATLGGTAGKADAIKQGAAHHLADIIIWSFCISVGWLLVESTYLMMKLMTMTGSNTADNVVKALFPFLKESASTVTSIFGSTLGFVLGYYFKNDSNQSSTTQSSTI